MKFYLIQQILVCYISMLSGMHYSFHTEIFLENTEKKILMIMRLSVIYNITFLFFFTKLLSKILLE